MAKISASDKMRIQTLREQGLGARAIKSLYPEKKWSLPQIHRICKKVDSTGSALWRKPGSGRPKTARTTTNIDAVQELICSQEDRPGTSLLEMYQQQTPKPRNSSELKAVLQSISDSLPQAPINKAVLAFRKTAGLHRS